MVKETSINKIDPELDAADPTQTGGTALTGDPNRTDSTALTNGTKRTVGTAERQAPGPAARLTLAAMLTAAALMFSYVESLVPVTFGIPGFKLGLANIAVITALYTLGAGLALMVNVTRIVLTALLFGNPFSIVYSLAGGMLSFLCMLALKKTGLFSVTGVSMAGGVIHNAGQLAAAAVAIGNTGVFALLPALIFAGAATGILNGIISQAVLSKLPLIGPIDRACAANDAAGLDK